MAWEKFHPYEVHPLRSSNGQYRILVIYEGNDPEFAQSIRNRFRGREGWGNSYHLHTPADKDITFILFTRPPKDFHA